MPRNRMIKADFWADEKAGKLSDSAKLLFIGIWNFADDSGVCRANHVFLRNNIFPFSSMTTKKIGELLQELCVIGVVVVGDYSGETYLLVKNFLKHQTINKPSSFRFVEGKYDEVFSGCSSSVVVVEEYYRPKVKEKEKEKEKVKENVSLLPAEIKKLKDAHGEGVYQKAIDKLSSYKMAHDKKYKSDYGAINTWVIDSLSEKKQGKVSNCQETLEKLVGMEND